MASDPTSGTTIDPNEAAHFGAMAADWWDPQGSSAMLHRLNPVRLAYIRDRLDQHWSLDECDIRPLKGRRAADVGCGAGLLAEPLARLGAEVTGVDPAPENIAVARAHALGQGLPIDYRVGSVEALSGRFDLITSLEVVEHVADVRRYLQGLADALADDGLLILSTPNRTGLSRFMLITAAEGTGQIPRGTHDWDKFLTPEELTAMLRDVGLDPIDCTGLSWGPGRGFHLSENKALNYLVTARRAG
ncbi:bifunctional 2-polyprenyl-6-hydroxyphenol methylase/3-demethylubiquinol 3-O-methyltransferase UbiG [Sphingosinicella sp. BN140058]|uniref:bifunctional 2-polyprenyl-6-hydroxyphenol methylase/3-demethylubiquinol 3-O-methyltransferase UbiG n=1 Tax=Sphingosinicella sp. BN140058 TaxID=1892855 RepID=UPI001010A26D|nr:bifunctional 2-polyprenyl-6-hydroxyphenol methylase/3-demethylubiquinol 3-O-methyltransferase UbiG [Sphingosinicella sp. BN140058]QAY79687.1 bifunctional 2-polyprenyl-6-hydroxyphenol methylase/3-demethylubiquinol 3-O-methyltransferase UbiG [Sphingosinicella sp. BN140058]